jgi:aminomethyltransferase
MVDFSGWMMPLHYGSQIEEHKLVRSKVGLFDVSHMAAVDIRGSEANDFLSYALANDIGRLEKGDALYSLMLNQAGGVVDDLLVYHMEEDFYRLVINAGNRESDMQWILSIAKPYAVEVTLREELGILALQGPAAEPVLKSVLPNFAEAIEATGRFKSLVEGDLMIARTGYTGEDGFELILPAMDLANLWESLISAGAAPCGLGARDTLRLEAGMCLYGHEMDQQTSPLEAGLAWTISWQAEDRDFLGKSALQAQLESDPERKLVGLELLDRGVLRQGQNVWDGGKLVGVITSGSISPVLGKSIALARVAMSVSSEVLVEIRGKRLAAKVTRPPFVSKSK